MNENKPASDQQAEVNALIRQKAWLKLAEHPHSLHVANQQQLTAVIGKLEQAMSPLAQGFERENHEFAIDMVRSLLKKRAKPLRAESAEGNDIDRNGYIAFLKEEFAEVIRRFEEEIQKLSQKTEREVYELEVAHLRTLLNERIGTQDDRGMYIAALEEQITKAEEGLEELAAVNQHSTIAQETTQVVSLETDMALSRLCARYIDSVKGYMLREKGGLDRELEMYVEPDERLMQLVEKWSKVSEGETTDFRRRIVSQVGALANEGKRFEYGSDDHLYMGLMGASLDQDDNLRRWKESGEPRKWVENHKGQWNHRDWLALLVTLKQSAYWPMETDTVGAVVEEIKKAYYRQSHRITSLPLPSPEAKKPGLPARPAIRPSASVAKGNQSSVRAAKQDARPVEASATLSSAADWTFHCPQCNKAQPPTGDNASLFRCPDCGYQSEYTLGYLKSRKYLSPMSQAA